MVKKFCRAWLQVKGEVVQACAIPSSVQLSPTELSMTFRADTNSSELAAIAGGSDYVVSENSVIREILECKPKNRVGRLKTSDGGRDFKIHDTDSAIAWYLLDETGKESEAKGLEIVPKSELKYEDQIAISQDGRIYVSENVNEKLVKFRCEIVIPRQVVHLPVPLPQILAHLVYEEGENVKYLNVSGTVLPEGKKGGTGGLRERQTVKIRITEQSTVILL